ncbi:MAG: alanyl-tRNA synthetase [Chlamydiales bacterium]|jgi:alanyl-tRNA synthetase|nr:alanyl-tRNA synthetase [Chlamydiales bacterium]
MLSQEIRRKFLQYFEKQKHQIIPSSAVIPHDDPTLLFTNAGMNQFKDVFLGKSQRDYTRATTSQKCIRAGGKHNDLENVGHTRRHLTLFEMLGNFSFGDYFKKEAMQFAWEVSTEVFGFDPERIWVTVFREDDEAYELWKKYVPVQRITRFDEKDNFWAMGETGPCGPCSELYYDRGPAYGSATKHSDDTEGERYLEFWNLVFMQYNRDASGQMIPLAKKSIDTGAGLERVVSLKMDVDNVFGTDILRSLIAQIENISGVKYELKDPKAPAFHVIADHIRTLSFAIADGAQPSNVDRGYVLRKILRRAVRYGRSLGFQEPFLAQVLPRLMETMGGDYPELRIAHNRIAEIITIEEESFLRTLRRGGNMLQQIITQAQGIASKKISGDDAFKLKDTYGFPLEEIELLAKDSHLQIDTERYQVLEEEAKERSRQSHKTTQQVVDENLFQDIHAAHGNTLFVGYNQVKTEAKIISLVKDGKQVEQLEQGELGMVILDRTPFYAEMGGQIGDTGVFKHSHGEFKVTDCKSPFTGVTAHIGEVSRGMLQVGDTLFAEINAERRHLIQNNHTATHLLHWALCKVLGEHVKQAGSVVDEQRLRFDFSHHKPLTREEIRQIEDLVNDKIRTNHPVAWYEREYAQVQGKADVKQFFGDKYSSVVRIVDIEFSKELCGGTHVKSLGFIGLFRIAKESSIAAGVRRIEAVTGHPAELLHQEQEELIYQVSELVKSNPNQLINRVQQLLDETRQLNADLKVAKQAQYEQIAQQLLSQVENINNIPVIAAEVNVTTGELRNFAQLLSAKMGPGVIALANSMDGKANLFIQVSPQIVNKGVHANQLIKEAAPLIGGSGGGKSDSAQAGGKDPSQISAALAKVKELIK